jgi:hypothetical protein
MNFFTFLNFRSSVVETPVKLTVDFSPIDFLHRQPHEIGNFKGTVSRDWLLTISSFYLGIIMKRMMHIDHGKIQAHKNG